MPTGPTEYPGVDSRPSPRPRHRAERATIPGPLAVRAARPRPCAHPRLSKRRAARTARRLRLSRRRGGPQRTARRQQCDAGRDQAATQPDRIGRAPCVAMLVRRPRECRVGPTGADGRFRAGDVMPKRQPLEICWASCACAARTQERRRHTTNAKLFIIAPALFLAHVRAGPPRSPPLKADVIPACANLTLPIAGRCAGPRGLRHACSRLSLARATALGRAALAASQRAGDGRSRLMRFISCAPTSDRIDDVFWLLQTALAEPFRLHLVRNRGSRSKCHKPSHRFFLSQMGEFARP